MNECDRCEKLAAALAHANECERHAAAERAERARAVEEAQREANLRADRLAAGRPAPRNCDLYQTCNEAWKAYNAIQDRHRLPGFDLWLFERAQAGAVAESAHCLRNCDVYTDPDEAQAAYVRYCMAGDHYGWSVWIQLPYEPEYEPKEATR